MYAYLTTSDCFTQVRQKFIAFSRQVGVIDPEDLNWQNILDNLYTSK